jgi:hypothetical protein
MSDSVCISVFVNVYLMMRWHTTKKAAVDSFAFPRFMDTLFHFSSACDSGAFR